MEFESVDDRLAVDFELLLMLKIKEFRQNNFKNINKEILRDYLFNIKWKRRNKLAVSDIASDIFELTASEVFEYLQTIGVKNSIHLSLEDFNDLIAK